MFNKSFDSIESLAKTEAISNQVANIVKLSIILYKLRKGKLKLAMTFTRTANYHNRFYIMRHGESEFNQRGLINSDPSLGGGLTTAGMEQVSQSVDASLLRELGSRVVIYCSELERAKQTALIVSQQLATDLPIVDGLLNERNFGQFDGQPNQFYEQVWQADARWPESCFELKQRGIESANQVAVRGLRAMAIADGKQQNSDILLVSHGDTLQILQTALSDVEPHRHRELPKLSTGEIRQLF